MISAEVICDSISIEGKRLTTFKLRYPKFIHSEFMTHRVISRNASSSRAIPTAKLIEEVRSDALRAAPVWWGKNQPGMQAPEELDLPSRAGTQNAWSAAAYDATVWAERLLEIGAHKQIVNRLLEPFSHINVIATATEWDNFFGLRLHPDAQPEMRALAMEMNKAKRASNPIKLRPGQWHLPFIHEEERNEEFAFQGDGNLSRSPLDEARAVSVARCARVSYESFDTGRKSTVEEDLKLFERLLTSGHWSPFEHQATPDSYNEGCDAPIPLGWQRPYLHGNFKGWCQYRKMMPNEACAYLPEQYRG